MVEAFVSSAIERIVDVLVREASLLYGMQDEVQQLQTELHRIRCFLQDVDSKQDQDERVRNWVVEIRDIAYEADDVIDSFLLLRAQTGSRRRVYGLIKRTTSMFSKVLDLHEIGTQIKSIQAKIVSVSASMQNYGIKLDAEGEGSRSTSEMQRPLRDHIHMIRKMKLRLISLQTKETVKLDLPNDCTLQLLQETFSHALSSSSSSLCFSLNRKEELSSSSLQDSL